MNNTISFRPGWLASLLILVLVPVFVSLGFWQLRRADEKQGLMNLQRARAEESPLALSAGMRELRDLRYHPVKLVGTYDRDQQILLDNQVFNGKAGYLVLTPMRLRGAEVSVLVNRGWVPVGADRRQFPDLPAPAGELEISGTLDRFAAIGLRLEGAEVPAPGWPAVVQVAVADVLATRLGYPLLPYQVLLSPAEPGGFQRAWRQIDLHPETSKGYALQWFGFAATALALYFWYGFRKTARPDPQS